jgi:predicted nucleotidyltransferase
MTLDTQAIADVFERYPGVRAVYLFGSHAAGTARPDSDVDLAVVPRDASVRERKLDILADLVRRGIDHVDLVILDTDDLVLQYEAVRYNRVIYQTPDFEPGTMYSYVIRRYLDFLPYLERQREAYKRRLLNDQD